MNNSKIIDGEELKGKIGAFTQYLIDKEKSNSTIEEIVQQAAFR